MRALILAAGRGERLRPLTDERPKPMIEVAGKPLLEHNVALLARYGVRDITINTHYLSAAIVHHFGDGSRFGVRIDYSEEPVLLGTAGALGPLRARMTETFLLVFGDNLSDLRLDRLIALHRERRAAATVGLYERENTAASGVAELGEGDRIVGFVEKPADAQTGRHWVNAGFVVLEPEVYACIPPGPSDLGRDVLPEMLRRGRPVYGYKMDERLYWIDSTDDYARTVAEFTGR
jgi:NDP-sugar pyrophosphorylase family protein